MDAEDARKLVAWNASGARNLFRSGHSGSLSSFAISLIDNQNDALETKLRTKFTASFQNAVRLELKEREHAGPYKGSRETTGKELLSHASKRPRVDGANDGALSGPTNSTACDVRASDGSALESPQHVSVVKDSGPCRDPNSSILDKVESEKIRPSISTLSQNSAGGLTTLNDGPAPGLSVSGVALRLAQDRPQWHAPWEMFRVIMGHAGWVRAVAVDPENQWFATGSADRTIKIWDLASGKLKITLTGHISTVRGIVISERHPYMFTVGEDKMVKCWDLEHNKVVRHYHGHLSGVYSVALHPNLDILMTGGRDAVVRVWDMRTKRQIFALSGHRDSVNAVVSQAADPQVVSASVDTTVRLWDLAAGKGMTTLTHHKKGVRSLAVHPNEFSFASASADSIKTWSFPRGDLLRNLKGHQGLVNALAVNHDGVLVSGGDDGIMRFWDYSSAYCFQETRTKVQPGSMDNEAGVFAMSFDRSGSRLITCETDKTVKIWRENEEATEETHPLEWTPDLISKRY